MKFAIIMIFGLVIVVIAFNTHAESSYTSNLADEAMADKDKKLQKSVSVNSVLYFFKDKNKDISILEIGKKQEVMLGGWSDGSAAMGTMPMSPIVWIFKDVPPEYAKVVEKGVAYYRRNGKWEFIRFVDRKLSAKQAAALFGVLGEVRRCTNYYSNSPICLDGNI